MFILSLILLAAAFAAGAYVESKYAVVAYVMSFFTGGEKTEV